MAAKQYKVLVLGDTGVGKTSMILKASTLHFPDPEKLKSTIGVAHHIIEVEDVKLIVWDFGGQEHYQSFISTMFDGAHGGVLVFDVTSKVTLDNIENVWIPLIQKVVDDMSVFILVGNKSDLKMKVSKEEIEKIAHKYGFQYFITSAKTDDTREIFVELKKIIDRSIEE